MNPRILFCTSLLLSTGPALSAELDYALSAGVTHSDNIERLPDGLERSANAAVVGLVLRGERPAGRLKYDVLADVTYNEYLDLNLNSEVFGRAALAGSYDFVPDTFGWNASVGYEQIRTDPFRPIAPGNSEDLLSFSTGPTLRARFSSVMQGELEGHYSRTDYGNRPFDNETTGGRALLVRRANPRSMIALGAAYDDVSYISSGVTSGLDFKRNEFFARTELKGVRTDLDLEVGYSKVNGQSFDDSGALVRTHLSRRISPALTGFLSAAREYPTSEDVSRSYGSLVVVGADQDHSELNSGPRQSTSVEGGFRFERTRMQAEVSYFRVQEDSLVATAAKRHRDEVRGSVSRRFTPGTRGTLFATLTKEDFAGAAGSSDERTAGAELAISFGRALAMDIRVQQRKHDGLTALDDSSELSGGLFLRYSGSLGAEPARR